MGQAKHNPISIAAKKGELPPKPETMSKRECQRLVLAQVQIGLAAKTGMPLGMLNGPYSNR